MQTCGDSSLSPRHSLICLIPAFLSDERENRLRQRSVPERQYVLRRLNYTDGVYPPDIPSPTLDVRGYYNRIVFFFVQLYDAY